MGPAASAAGTTYDPARLALWTEFHEQVAMLSEQERAVFEMHYYLELPQVEIAQVLELHPRKVSYLWIAATEKLGEGLDAAL
jgi:DNA-directed RNA polymerase specialized sigma24 family protein